MAQPQNKYEDAYWLLKKNTDEERLFLAERICKLTGALEVIATLPMPEQDNQLSANMRKIAADAIRPTE